MAVATIRGARGPRRREKFPYLGTRSHGSHGQRQRPWRSSAVSTAGSIVDPAQTWVSGPLAPTVASKVSCSPDGVPTRRRKVSAGFPAIHHQRRRLEGPATSTQITKEFHLKRCTYKLRLHYNTKTSG